MGVSARSANSAVQMNPLLQAWGSQEVERRGAPSKDHQASKGSLLRAHAGCQVRRLPLDAKWRYLACAEQSSGKGEEMA